MGMRYRAAAIDADVASTLAEADAATLDGLLAEGIDLYKWWHAAQVLITDDPGTQEPLLAGTPVGEDMGYGSPMLAGPDDVRRIARDLGELDHADLVARFSVDRMRAEMVYPMVWDEDPDRLASEVVGAAVALLTLYRDAAAEGRAILAAIV